MTRRGSHVFSPEIEPIANNLMVFVPSNACAKKFHFCRLSVLLDGTFPQGYKRFMLAQLQ